MPATEKFTQKFMIHFQDFFFTQTFSTRQIQEDTLNTDLSEHQPLVSVKKPFAISC